MTKYGVGQPVRRKKFQPFQMFAQFEDFVAERARRVERGVAILHSAVAKWYPRLVFWNVVAVEVNETLVWDGHKRPRIWLNS